ncbi:MAG: FAD-binding oxidoreductase [Xenococcaceae cyanobacterium]
MAVQMEHDERILQIMDEVCARPADKRLTIGKKRPGHRPHDWRYKRACHSVDVSRLNHIHDIDQAQKTVRVEASVTLGSLCRQTLEQSLMPQVVPEHETFTVAGLINGLGLETSSHRYGLFSDSIESMHVVLGNGQLVKASEKENQDLFYMLPGSLGTLGIVIDATLRLNDAKPYLCSHYIRFEKLEEYVEAYRQSLQKYGFVEGFVIAPGTYILVNSDYCSPKDDLPIYYAAKHGELWYYQHATLMAEKNSIDIVPTYDYMFRHQRSAFWMSGIMAGLSFFKNTRWGRTYLDKEVERKVRKQGFQTNMPQEFWERAIVLQDMVVNLNRLQEGIEYVEKNIGVYPLWNCAAKATGHALVPQKPDSAQDEIVVDIGIYGEPTIPNYRFFTALKELQLFVDFPSFWGVSYLSESETKDRIDLDAYHKLRKRYYAEEAFISLQDKLQKANITEDVTPLKYWRLLNLWWDIKSLFCQSKT